MVSLWYHQGDGSDHRVRPDCAKSGRLIRLATQMRLIQNAGMQLKWPWNRGPKRGIARSVAVFGSPGFAEDADEFASHLGQRDELERRHRNGETP